MGNYIRYEAQVNDQQNFNPKWVGKKVKEIQSTDNTALLSPFARWYFVIAGQWFSPLEEVIVSRNLPRKACRIAYAIWQVLVVLFIWAFWLYSLGFLHMRTLEQVDWLCPLTDIKNMVHGLCWIVNQQAGLIFFLLGKLENLLEQLSITKEEVWFRWGWGKGGTVRFIQLLFQGTHRENSSKRFKIFRFPRLFEVLLIKKVFVQTNSSIGFNFLVKQLLREHCREVNLTQIILVVVGFVKVRTDLIIVN